ncbi:MAG: hypothetical protein HRT95_11545 [Moritella sp.]|uniref:hypothetical protein n=1 Tax=Moritella sp. TaxID=78556 RepID=UPI001DC8AFF9|nr:hypothetical protein [Moritella sp.]NQZ50773.1 hypothetical protein [Moritella sp.]
MRILKLTATILFITLVTGCASFEKSSSVAADLQQDKIINLALNQRVQDAVTQVEQDYLQAKDENFSYYAPRTWQSVEQDLVSTRKLVNRFDPNNQGFFGGPSESSVLASIAEVSVQLIQAQKIKHQVTTILAQPLADIEYLTPKVGKEWQRDLSNINHNIIQFINNIEKNRAVSRQQIDRDRIQKKVHDLEINLVNAEYYSPLEKQFHQLNKQLIPQSYNEVFLGLQRLNNVITTAPRDTTALTDTANWIKKDIQSAKHIAADVNWINNLDKNQREEIVLHYRATLEGLGLKFLNQDLSNLSYKAQVTTFERELSAQLAEFATKESDVAIIDDAITGDAKNKIKNTLIETSTEEEIAETTQVTTHSIVNN